MKNFLIGMWMMFGLMIERFMAGFGLIQCLDMYDIDYVSGQDNTGGLTQTFYFAKAEDIDSWPTIATKSTATDYDELMKYQGDFTMKAGKRFYKGYLTWGTGELKWDAQGGMDGKSFKQSLEISRPGCDEKALAFLDMVKNANLVFIVLDKDGNYRVLGSEFLAAKLESSAGTTGKTGEDSKADVMTFVSELASPPRFYDGTIPLTEASGSV